MLEIRLLGQFDVRFNGTPVEIASRPAQVLLAKLALNAGITHRREFLAGELWPDTTETNARNNLRHAIWRIRAAFKSMGLEEDVIIADNIGLVLVPDAVRIDAVVFERDSSRLGASRDTSIEDMLTTAALYYGTLLPGFYDDWSLTQRNRFQLLFDTLMSQLTTGLRNQNRWLEMLYWGSAWALRSEAEDTAVNANALAMVRLAIREIMALDNADAPLPSETVWKAIRRILERLNVLLSERPNQQKWA